MLLIVIMIVIAHFYESITSTITSHEHELNEAFQIEENMAAIERILAS